MENQGTEDKRLFQRFPSRFPAKFKDSREGFGAKVFLRDSSGMGMKLTSKECLYLNDSVSVEVDLPDGMSPMSIRGQVVWTKNREPNLWEVGLKFHKINLTQMSRLYKFIVPHPPE